MKRTSIATAAHLVCQFWHHLKQLNGIVNKANAFWLDTGLTTI